MPSLRLVILCCVLCATEVACSGSSSGSGDSEPGASRDSAPTDQAKTDAAPAGKDGASSADGAGACRVNPAGVCNANTAGFTCPNRVTPEESSICPLSTRDTSGGLVSCCTIKPTSSSCSRDPGVACPNGADGYSCTSWDTPPQSSLIICDKMTSAGSSTGFCCREYQSSSCRLDPTGAGCGNDMYSFRCTGATTPSSDDSGLSCSSGSAWVDGSTGYCCSSKG